MLKQYLWLKAKWWSIVTRYHHFTTFLVHCLRVRLHLKAVQQAWNESRTWLSSQIPVLLHWDRWLIKSRAREKRQEPRRWFDLCSWPPSFLVWPDVPKTILLYRWTNYNFDIMLEWSDSIVVINHSLVMTELQTMHIKWCWGMFLSCDNFFRFRFYLSHLFLLIESSFIVF